MASKAKYLMFAIEVTEFQWGLKHSKFFPWHKQDKFKVVFQQLPECFLETEP